MITYTDALGVVLDTGVATQPTARPNTELETHNASEIDTGTRGLTVSQIVALHSPHRPVNSPR
jgi:hypothetical protein